MKEKETDPRLAEARRDGKPPMLRCWVNEHFQGIVFSTEAQVIVERIDGKSTWTVVPKDEIIYLGISQKGDALGPFRDAYIHVRILLDSSNEEGYVVNIASCDPGEDVRMKVAKDSVVFSKADDPIWQEIEEQLAKEAEGKIPDFQMLSKDQIAIDASTGSVVRIDGGENAKRIR